MTAKTSARATTSASGHNHHRPSVTAPGQRTTVGQRTTAGGGRAEALLDLQRSVGNRAIVDLMRQAAPGSPSGASSGVALPPVQRLFGRSKKPAPPQDPPVSPLMARQISSIIANHPTMKQAETLRSKGKEDDALQVLEGFWNSSLMVKDDATGKYRRVQLSQFKPLMFTPSERRMLRIKKWRLAVVVKNMWEEAVRKGEVHDPNPETAETDYSKSVDTVTGIVDGIGGATTTGDLGAKIGGKIELMEAVKSSGTPPTPPETIKQEISGEWKSLTDKGSISNKNDSNYEAQKFANKGEWADGIITIVGDAVSLVSSVTKVISAILDKKATKADVASQIADSLSQASSTAGAILTAIERAQVSELTTNMFHWVPGLSIFSNGFAALSSAVSLVQKAVRLHGVRTARSKVTEKERDDLSFALKRVWVRSSQQVEQDSFNTAKALTNTGLSIAEVASGGGFGIPRLAQIVVSASGAVHNFGHTVADSVRAGQSKSARSGYFAAHASGSAEKLIRTDPLAAAETIISRAGEGDTTALALLKTYDIKLPGLTMPFEKDESVTTGGGGTQNERMLNYNAKDTLLYQEAVDKLMQGLKEDDTPKTLWDKVKESVTNGIKAPGAMRDRYRQASRIRDLRNDQNYGGVKNRGTWWSIKQTVFAGESGVRKLSETTAKRINEAFVTESSGVVGPKEKKSFSGIDNKYVRDQLLAQIEPEEILQAKRKNAEAERSRPRVDISGPLTQGQIAEVQQAGATAQNMAIGALGNMMRGGRPNDMLPDVWKVYVAVYAERFNEPRNLIAVGN